MALEDPNNIKKAKPVEIQEPAAETEHGAVKKKIKIPGFGEIEYTERIINFPERIVQETGGVIGYKRKTITWEELSRFFGVNNVRKLRWTDSENFEEKGGTASVIGAMTNNEFIDQTLNHLVYGDGGVREENLTKDRMLDTFDNGVGFITYDIVSNKKLSADEVFEREHAKSKEGVYLQSDYGLNVTDVGELWIGRRHDRILPKGAPVPFYGIEGSEGVAVGPDFDRIVLGFKLNTRNKALRSYGIKVLEIMEKQGLENPDIINANKSFTSSSIAGSTFREYSYRTLKGIIDEIRIFDQNGIKYIGQIISGFAREAMHPRIPMVKNHPDIPELRWCHADYAAIPTKNGYNIIEMIT